MRLAILAGMISAALSGSLLAAPAAYVHELQGDARAVVRGQSRNLQVGSTLEAGEQVVTGKGSATIKFEDGQIVAIREDSVFEISTYNYDTRKVRDSNVVLSLLKGGFRYVTGVIGDSRRDAIRIRVATATAGIRGTDVIFIIGPGGEVIATVQEGAISFTNQDSTTQVDAGQGSVARRASAPDRGTPVGNLAPDIVNQAAGLSQKNLPGNNPISVIASAELAKAVADAAEKARLAAEAAKKAADSKSAKDAEDAARAKAAADLAARDAVAKANEEAKAAETARKAALDGGAAPDAGKKPPTDGQGVGLPPKIDDGKRDGTDPLKSPETPKPLPLCGVSCG